MSFGFSPKLSILLVTSWYIIEGAYLLPTYISSLFFFSATFLLKYYRMFIFSSGRINNNTSFAKTDSCMVFGEGWVTGRRDTRSSCWGLLLELCSLVSVQYIGTLWDDRLTLSLVSLQICYPLIGVELVGQGLDMEPKTQEKQEVVALEGKSGAGAGLVGQVHFCSKFRL